jgi:hypothetical protein
MSMGQSIFLPAGPYSSIDAALVFGGEDVIHLGVAVARGAVIHQIRPTVAFKVVAPHSGQSSQLVLGATDRNAQFLPTIARSNLVGRVDRTVRPQSQQPNNVACWDYLLTFIRIPRSTADIWRLNPCSVKRRAHRHNGGSISK